MTRDEALKKYLALKNARRLNAITDVEFTAMLGAVTFTDERGRKSGFDPATGRVVVRGSKGGRSAGPSAPPPLPLPKGAKNKAEPELPTAFMPLLMLIVTKTIGAFLRKLPFTIMIGVGAMLFHTYLLVVVNNGYQKSSFIGSFLSINQNYISSFLIWMIGSALVMALITRFFGSKNKKKVTLKERVAAVLNYIQLKTNDAFAVIAASAGLALVVGAFVNGSANLMLALGAGALLASRAGSVIALLVRTAWNNAFSILRNKTMKEHGLAIGYVTMLTGSAGFLLSSLLTPGGAVLGFLLLGGALAYAFSQWRDMSGLSNLLLLGVFLAIAALLLSFPELALAHDGGWPEYMGNAPLTPGNILIYLQKGGSIAALTRGLPPGAAAAAGAALAQALNALGQSAPDIDVDIPSTTEPSSGSEPDTSDNSKIRDGDDARNWLIRNGYYDANGNPTQKLETWWNLPPGSNVKTGLAGFATDDNGNVVIITTDGPPGTTDAPTRSDGSTPADGSGADGSATDADAQDADGQQDSDEQDSTQQDGDDQSGEPDTHYNDPEWSQRNNPDPYNMDWDPDQQRWRSKDDLYAERMQRQGYGFDPDNDAWRKPPDAPNLEDVPDYSGTKYSTEWKPGLITYDVTTEGLDKHLDNLSRLERDALDAYRDLNDQIAQAEANGDTWLADQLRGNQDKVREHINELQGQRNNIVNAVNNENTRVADYDRKIREPGLSGHTKQALQDGWDIARQIVNDPGMLTRDPDFTEKVRAGIQAADQVRKGEGIELRPGLFGFDKVKTGPSIAEQFDDALKDVKDLNTQLEDARQRGDTDAVNRLTGELNAAKDEAQRLSGDLQQHVRDIKKWQVRSAQANLSIGRKGTEIAAELASVPSTAHAVTGLIDDFNRGQGIFHRSTFRESGDGVDLDLNNPSVKNPVRMTPHDVDLDAQYHANVRIGTERANRALQAMSNPDASEEEVAEAINRALESRNSKIQLNGQSDDVNEQFYNAVEKHRTTPLLERTSKNLNDVTLEDGRSRYYVTDPETGLERPVQRGDWSLASGPKDRPSVGQDLDFYNPNDKQIMDRLTGRPIKPEAVNEAIDGACEHLNINRRAQEINYTHSMDPESYRLRPGQTPKEHITGAADFDSYEARQATDITGYKVKHAEHNYDTHAEGIAEGGRATNKELNRIVNTMLEDPRHADAALPSYFNNKTTIPKGDGDYKTVLEVLNDVGNDRIPTGTGQAAIRSATGRNIADLNDDIAHLQESIIKLRPPAK